MTDRGASICQKIRWIGVPRPPPPSFDFPLNPPSERWQRVTCLRRWQMAPHVTTWPCSCKGHARNVTPDVTCVHLRTLHVPPREDGPEVCRMNDEVTRVGFACYFSFSFPRDWWGCSLSINLRRYILWCMMGSHKLVLTRRLAAGEEEEMIHLRTTRRTRSQINIWDFTFDDDSNDENKSNSYSFLFLCYYFVHYSIGSATIAQEVTQENAHINIYLCEYYSFLGMSTFSVF